ncbi:MAG: sulfate transporter [Prevotella sp.]|nr:sulfate transporter [Prevotella sp.]MBR6192310.1 sulfate transporter [Prevotella sp.]
MNELSYYALAIVAIIVAVILLKRFVGCLFRIIVTVILMALLGAIYYYMKFYQG